MTCCTSGRCSKGQQQRSDEGGNVIVHWPLLSSSRACVGPCCPRLQRVCIISGATGESGFDWRGRCASRHTNCWSGTGFWGSVLLGYRHWVHVLGYVRRPCGNPSAYCGLHPIALHAAFRSIVCRQRAVDRPRTGTHKDRADRARLSQVDLQASGRLAGTRPSLTAQHTMDTPRTHPAVSREIDSSLSFQIMIDYYNPLGHDQGPPTISIGPHWGNTCISP